MSQSNEPALGINSWLEDELYYQYQFDRKSVDEGWTELFQQSAGQNGGAVPADIESVPTTVPAQPQSSAAASSVNAGQPAAATPPIPDGNSAAPASAPPSSAAPPA